jgi:hypothetical protein
LRDPILLFEKEWLLQKNAADDFIRPDRGIRFPVLLDALPHFRKGLRAVLILEGVPGVACRALGEAAEEAASDDEVPRAVQLEEERFARINGPESSSAGWLPEVNLIGPLD